MMKNCSSPWATTKEENPLQEKSIEGPRGINEKKAVIDLTSFTDEPSIGECIVLETFLEFASQELKSIDLEDDIDTDSEDDDSSSDDEPAVPPFFKKLSEFLAIINSLQGPEPALLSPNSDAAHFRVSVTNALESRYMDPFRAKQYYVLKLISYIDLWQRRSNDYIAPYTSLVNSSMMGKTRLAKEISFTIPTIYICARSQNLKLANGSTHHGYPRRSPNRLCNYLIRDFLSVSNVPILEQVESMEYHYFRLFIGILKALRIWAQATFKRFDPAAHLPVFRELLWRHLAQREIVRPVFSGTPKKGKTRRLMARQRT
jgi:hypothetical protein